MGAGHPLARWTDKTDRQQAAEEGALREARAAFEEAEQQVSPRLVARNAIAQRRSDLALGLRALEARIEAAEAELERARGATGPDRDLLTGIRKRLGLGSGPGLPAA